MPQMTNSNPDGPRAGLDPIGLLYLLAAGHSTCLLVFVRRRFGTEAFRANGLVAIAVIITYGGLAGAHVMWPFLWVYLAMLVVRRIESVRDHAPGAGVHSRYGGWPWLAMRLSRAKGEQAAKSSVEPLLCLVAGFALMPLSPALGVFVAAGCLSLMVKTGIERWLFEARVRSMRDAAIENRQLADAFNGDDDGF